MLRRIDIAIDCSDPDAQAQFWAAALGYVRFGEWEQYRSIVPCDGVPGPKIVLQTVAEAKSVKDRIHIDMVVDDVAAEVSRLESLGAARSPEAMYEQPDLRWVTMLDPEGNEFCVCAD